jgi:hypothetical protein
VLLGGAGAGGTYTAGTGLSLVANEFAINTAVTARKLDMQSGAPNYCRSTTGNDTYVCALTPTLTAYTRGGCLVLDADTANTLTATIDVDTLGAKSILNRAGAALSTGDITANKPITLCYDGTQYIIQGDGGGGGGSTTQITTNWYLLAGGGAGTTIGPEFQQLGTGYTAVSASANTNPTRGYVSLSPNAGTPWGFLFSHVLPDTWDATGDTKILFKGNTGATTGDKTYSVETMCLGDGENFNGAFSFAAAQTLVVSMPVTELQHTSSITLDSTSLTGCAAGVVLYVRVSRPDAVAGSLQLRYMGISYRETLD